MSRKLRTILHIALALAIPACNLRDAMTADVSVVARAGEQQLRVDDLAEMLASAKTVGLRPGIVEQWAQLWIDYSLFVQQMAGGDSLIDTGLVRRAMWFDIDSIRVDRFHTYLVDSLVEFDTAYVDSAFAAGEHRMLDIVLLETRADLAPPERAAKRGEADALRGRLAAGGSWDQAKVDYQKPGGGSRGGRVMVGSGTMSPELDPVAFALAPGEMSDVIETARGFYLLRRPALEEVREDYAWALQDTLVGRMQAQFLEDLPERWRVAVRGNAPALMREAVGQPYAAIGSGKTLGTYRDGKLTVGEFVRWLPVLGIHQQVGGASDEQLHDLVEALIRNEVLFHEADQRNIRITDEEFALIRERYAVRLDTLRRAMDLDVLLSAGGTTPDMRQRLLELSVMRYLSEIMQRRRQMVSVPPFLAEALRERQDWSVAPAALERTVEETRARRAELANMAPEGDAPPADASPQERGGGDDQ
jgi:parvulin-like peptidyl-prolyl isomerase